MPDTLTLFAIAGFTLSFITGALSQLWKSSVELEGRITKQLTPAGWLSMGISLVGLSAAVAAALVKMNQENDKKLQAALQAELATKQANALREQEGRWQDYVSSLLETATKDINTNIENTIGGFRDSQARFNQAQSALAASKQALLENSLRHTNQIILASQPLTSLTLRWGFASSDPTLWRAMKTSQERIDENLNETQGHSTPTPIDYAEYEWQVVPLLAEIARLATPEGVDEETANKAPYPTALALIPLDDSENTILSFGYVSLPSDAEGNEQGGQDGAQSDPGTTQQALLPQGGRIPWAEVDLASNARATSRYAFEWTLDPATLANSVHRRNSGVPPMANLPKTLRIAVIRDVAVLPVEKNNYSIPVATNLWSDHEYGRTYLSLGRSLMDMRLVLEANGYQSMRQSYVLKRAYALDLLDEYDESLGTAIVFEFETA